MFLAACVQMRCTTDIDRNLDMAETLIRRAASQEQSSLQRRKTPRY